MPFDSRELDSYRRDRWFLRGVLVFQIVVGVGFWLIVLRYAYRAAVWVGSAIAATGVNVMPFVASGLALIGAYAIVVTFNLMD